MIETYNANLVSTEGPACIRPWTSLEERSLVGDFQICCWINSILGIIKKDSDEDFMKFWNNNIIQNTRESFVNGTFLKDCPIDCPILVKKKFQPDYLDLFQYDSAEYETFSSEFKENREKVLDSIVLKKTVLDTFPLHLKVHPSNICNLDCRMCNLDKKLKQKLSKSYFENIYKMMPYLENIVIFGGEPFACRFTREIIFGGKIRNYPQIHFSTITNGTLLDNKLVEKLRDLKLGWFSFSLDSCKEKTYEQIRVNAKYDKTFSNIENFVKKRDNGDISVREIKANFAIQSVNYTEIADFISYTHSLNIQPNFTFVSGSHELLGKFDEVRACINEGIYKARELGNNLTVLELQYFLKSIPKYEAKTKKLYYYAKLFKIINRDKIVSFLQKHNKFKRVLRKFMGV